MALTLETREKSRLSLRGCQAICCLAELIELAGEFFESAGFWLAVSIVVGWIGQTPDRSVIHFASRLAIWLIRLPILVI